MASRGSQAGPRIEFDEDRKNGRGSAAILAGVDVTEEYPDYLNEEWDDWNGALFPSNQSEDGTRFTIWVANRIDDIVSRAGLTLSDGSTPTARNFCRSWFKAYSEALSHYLDRVDGFSEDKRSDDPQILNPHYLPDRQRRDHLRYYARITSTLPCRATSSSRRWICLRRAIPRTIHRRDLIDSISPAWTRNTTDRSSTRHQPERSPPATAVFRSYLDRSARRSMMNPQ